MGFGRETNLSVILLVLLIGGSCGNQSQLLKHLTISEGNIAMMKCTKSIISMEKMKNILIVGRSEHFLETDLSMLGNVTVMKVYQRNRGWKDIYDMLQFKWMIFILMFRRHQEINEYFSVFQRIQHFNSRLPFIIWPVHEPTEEDIKSCSRLLLNNRVTNFLILVKKQTTIELVTNFPYHNRTCGEHSSDNDKVIATFDEHSGFRNVMENFNRKHYYAESFHSQLFPPKVPRNLHKCQIRVVTGLWPPNVIGIHRTHFPGIEIEFLRITARYMNYAPVFLYRTSQVGNKLPNGSWSGFMGYLARDEADMAIGAVHIEAHRLYNFDVSDWYLYNYMLWIVPLMEAPPKSAIFEHFIIKSGAIAKLLFVSIFFATMSAMLIAARVVRSIDSKNYGNIGYVTLTFIGMGLSQPMHDIPRTVQVRRIFGWWLGFCTFIIFFAHTSITSYFMSPEQAVQLNNINEALDLGLAVTHDEYYNRFVIEYTNDPDIVDRNQKLPVIPSLNLVARGEAVTFIDQLRAVYITKQWLREDGSIPIRMLESTNLFRYWVQVVMQKGHPLSAWVNDLVGKSWTNGFWAFKQKQYIDRRTIQCSVRRQIILHNDYHKINNTEAVAKYNDAINEVFPKGEANEEVNEIFEPTPATEQELLEIFRVNMNSSITFSHLRPFFKYYLFALIGCIFTFFGEMIIFRLNPYIRRLLHKWRISKQ